MPQPSSSRPSDAPSSPADIGPDELRLAARWWEPRRVLHNAVLSLVFVALVVRTWARIEPELDASAIARLLVLAALANVCYSVAYGLDLPLQAAFAHPARDRARWAVWTLGTLFAVLVETYWYLDEILPPIH